MPSVGKKLPEHVTVCGAGDYPASSAAKAGMKTSHSSHRLKFQGMMKPMACGCWHGLIGHLFQRLGAI